jgi:hypothetical protein
MVWVLLAATSMTGGLATTSVVGVSTSTPSFWSQAYTRTWPYSGVSPKFWD